MSDRVDAQMLADWRINYNLVGRTPAEAMRWWHDHMDGKAPAGVVAALGLCINEIERLTAALRAQPGPVSIDDMEWAGKVHLAEAIRERDELRRQLAEAELDAQRYRDWLRGGANIPPESTRWARWEVRYWDGRHWNTLFAEQMDAAIDAAMGSNMTDALKEPRDQR